MPTPVLAPKHDTEPLISEALNENVTLLDQVKESKNFFADSISGRDLKIISEQRRRKVIKASVHPSRSTTALVELGDLHTINNRFGSAIKAYKNAISLDAYNVDAYKKLIPLLIQKNDFKQVDSYYKELLVVTSNHPSIKNDYFTFKLATSNGNKTIIDSLENALKESIKQSVEYSSFKLTLGILYLIYRNNNSKAKELFLEVLRSDPENIDANNNVGICYQNEKKFTLALRHFNAAIEKNKKYLAGYENIASCYTTQNKIDKALKVLEDAKDYGLNLSHTWDHNFGFFLIITKQFKRAKSWYRDKLIQEPSNYLLHNNYGVTLENLGEFEAAKEKYTEAVDIYLNIRHANWDFHDSRAFNAFQNACRMLYKTDEFPQMEVVAKYFVENAPENPAARYYLGASSIYVKKYKQARDNLEKSIEIYDGAVEPYLDLSYLYVTIIHEYELAIALLEKAQEININNELIYNNLAYAYIKVENLKKAENLLDIDLQIPPIFATKGLLYFHKGNFKKGNQLYEKAIQALAPSKQPEARQVWKFERATYMLSKNKLHDALDELREAKKISEKYPVYTDIVDLEKHVKALLKSTANS